MLFSRIIEYDDKREPAFGDPTTFYHRQQGIPVIYCERYI